MSLMVPSIDVDDLELCVHPVADISNAIANVRTILNTTSFVFISDLLKYKI